MFYNQVRILGGLLAGFALCCSPPVPSPASTSPCWYASDNDSVKVAQVGPYVITQKGLRNKFRKLSMAQQKGLKSPSNLRKQVEDEIRYELLVQAAFEKGIANDRDVVEAARQVMVRKLLQKELGSKIFGQKIKEKTIDAYYKKHRDEYQQSAKVRFMHIQFAPDNKGLGLAQQILKQLKSSKQDTRTFRLLVFKYSLDTKTKENGGEVGFQSRQNLLTEFGLNFSEKIFAGRRNELIEVPVQSKLGWHIVQIVSKREARTRRLNEVRENIQERLLKEQRSQHFEKYLAGIKKRYPVKIFEEALLNLHQALTKDAL